MSPSVRTKIGELVDTLVYEQVRDQISAEIGLEARAQAYTRVCDPVSDLQVRSPVYAQILEEWANE